jgi:type II secretory pathway pseudopilin PulG
MHEYFNNIMSHFFNKKKYPKKNQGFLLAELIVAVFLFSLFATVSIGSIINLLDANRKTQSLKSITNNLNQVLDSMTKELAVGKDYDCGYVGGPTDCPFPTGGSSITFLSNEDTNGDGVINDLLITYRFNAPDPETGDGGYIEREINPISGGPAIRMTAKEVNITKLVFFVNGTAPFTLPDTYQPKVTIFIDGTTKTAPRGSDSSFHIQTSVTQRIPDDIASTL